MSEKLNDSSEPDFSEFDDWNRSKFGFSVRDKDLNNHQKQIVKNNIALLLHREKWEAKVKAFEAKLIKIEDKQKRKNKRDEFVIHFNRHEFNLEYRNFVRYHFPCFTSFQRVNFGEDYVDFSEAQFSEGGVSFLNAKFGKEGAGFIETKFSNGSVSFEEAKFEGGSVSFAGANFGEGVVIFDEAIFGNDSINFSRSDFKGSVSFRKTKFGKGDVSFEDVKIAGTLDINATFKGKVKFIRLDVLGSASFARSKFKTVPNFRDMNLNRPPEVADMEVPPKKLKMGDNPFAKYSGDKNDASKYRKLKSMAIAASDHVKSGEFFAYEMMAKRGFETKGKFTLFVDYLYGLFSGYGQSFKRPLIWLIGLWVGFACLNIWKIFQELVFKSELDFWQNIGLSFTISARNLIPFFNSLSRFAPSPKGYESWFQKSMNRLETESVNIDFLTFFGIIEQLIGAILLFLLLLGLRNKFRLK